MKSFNKAVASFIIFMLLMPLLCLNVFGAGMYFYDNEWHNYTGRTLGVMVNDKLLDTPIPPLIFGDRSTVPARAVFEELGATVVWVSATAQVNVILGNKKIVLNINSKAAYVNNEFIEMEIPPKIINGNTMIPVRFVSEHLGFIVNFDEENGIIKINSPPLVANISDIKTSTASDNFYITFSSDREVTFESFTLDDPYRLVIDVFSGKVSSDKSYAINTGKLKAVRVANHPDKARIVIDFSGFCPALVKVKDGKTFYIEMAKEDLSVSTPTPVLQTAPPIITAPPASSNATQTPNSGYIAAPLLVVLDPGHGGNDSGALGKEEGKTVLEEADVNLDISLRVYKRLKAAGVNVVMTRSKDDTVELLDRSSFANKLGGYLFISIHNNSTLSPDISGTMVLSYLDFVPNSDYQISSQELGQIVLSELLQTIDTSDKGQRDGSTMSVIRKTNMPAIIVEVAFLSNEEDLGKLMNDAFKEKAATGIANGIIKAIKLVNDRLAKQSVAPKPT